MNKILTSAACIGLIMLSAMAASLQAAPPEGSTLNFEDQFDAFSGVDPTSPQLVDVNGDGYLYPRMPAWDGIHQWGYHLYAWNRSSFMTSGDVQAWTYENNPSRTGVALDLPIHQLTGSSTLKINCYETCTDAQRLNTIYGFACGMISTERSYRQQYGSFEVRARVANPHQGVQWSICLVDPLWVNQSAQQSADDAGQSAYDDGMDAGWRQQRPAEHALSRIWIADVVDNSTNSIIMGTYHCDKQTVDQDGNMQAEGSASGHDSRETISGIDPTQWHRYGLVWTESTLTWYVDGVQEKQMPNTDVLLYTDNASGTQESIVGFRNYMHICIEGHVAGQRPGCFPYAGIISSEDQLPWSMEIDYVKAWDGNLKPTTVVPSKIVKPARGAIAARQVRLNGTCISESRPLVISLSNPAQASVAIFDLGGRVRYSASSLGDKGAHTMTWNGVSNDGKRLPAGLYMCKVSLVNKTVSARLTVMP